MWGLLPEARRRALRHAHECPACRAALEARTPGLVRPPVRAGQAYDRVLDQVMGSLAPHIRQASRERSEAPVLLAELDRQAPGRRELLVRNARRFRSFSLGLLLLDHAREVSPGDPRGGEAWARLALQLTDALDAKTYGPALIEDVRARAWALTGSARRFAGDLFGAEQAFRQAEEHLRSGTRDHLERAQMLVLKAVLRRMQRRFHEAEQLVRRALSIWLSAGESRRAVEAMLTWSVVHGEHGEPERAIRLLREASELPSALSDPQLAHAIHHNLAMFLIQAGKLLEAEGVLLHSRDLTGQVQVPGLEPGRKWAQGQLARGLGRMGEAEALFTELRGLFLEQGRTYDAAQVTVELALVLLATGRTAEAEDLAHEAFAAFVALGVEHEALGAFLLARQAGDPHLPAPPFPAPASCRERGESRKP